MRWCRVSRQQQKSCQIHFLLTKLFFRYQLLNKIHPADNAREGKNNEPKRERQSREGALTYINSQKNEVTTPVETKRETTEALVKEYTAGDHKAFILSNKHIAMDHRQVIVRWLLIEASSSSSAASKRNRRATRRVLCCAWQQEASTAANARRNGDAFSTDSVYVRGAESEPLKWYVQST